MKTETTEPRVHGHRRAGSVVSKATARALGSLLADGELDYAEADEAFEVMSSAERPEAALAVMEELLQGALCGVCGFHEAFRLALESIAEDEQAEAIAAEVEAWEWNF